MVIVLHLNHLALFIIFIIIIFLLLLLLTSSPQHNIQFIENELINLIIYRGNYEHEINGMRGQY